MAVKLQGERGVTHEKVEGGIGGGETRFIYRKTEKFKDRANTRTRHLILDESDRLLSSDFLPQIQPIVEACTNQQIQKCFLSATMPAGPEAIASQWLKDGVRVVVGLK